MRLETTKKLVVPKKLQNMLVELFEMLDDEEDFFEVCSAIAQEENEAFGTHTIYIEYEGE